MQDARGADDGRVNFAEMARALREEDIDYILVGAAALNAHGIVRATEDMDLFVRVEPTNIDQLRRALRRIRGDPEIDEISAEDLAGEYPVVRYGPPGEDSSSTSCRGWGRPLVSTTCAPKRSSWRAS
jgi:hypothetical protein